jgi:hypothetical protein
MSVIQSKLQKKAVNNLNRLDKSILSAYNPNEKNEKKVKRIKKPKKTGINPDSVDQEAQLSLHVL